MYCRRHATFKCVLCLTTWHRGCARIAKGSFLQPRVLGYWSEVGKSPIGYPSELLPADRLAEELCDAAEKGEPERLRELLEKGADPGSLGSLLGRLLASCCAALPGDPDRRCAWCLPAGPPRART